MMGKCDDVTNRINRENLYPGERAIRASDAGSFFLVLLRDEEGRIRQVEYRPEIEPGADRI